MYTLLCWRPWVCSRRPLVRLSFGYPVGPDLVAETSVDTLPDSSLPTTAPIGTAQSLSSCLGVLPPDAGCIPSLEPASASDGLAGGCSSCDDSGQLPALPDRSFSSRDCCMLEFMLLARKLQQRHPHLCQQSAYSANTVFSPCLRQCVDSLPSQPRLMLCDEQAHDLVPALLGCPAGRLSLSDLIAVAKAVQLRLPHLSCPSGPLFSRSSASVPLMICDGGPEPISVVSPQYFCWAAGVDWQPVCIQSVHCCSNHHHSRSLSIGVHASTDIMALWLSMLSARHQHIARVSTLAKLIAP